MAQHAGSASQRNNGRKSDAIEPDGLRVFRRPSPDGDRAGRARARRRELMNWFRSRIRSGARLALFALALQMVVSFGHMHDDDLGLPPPPASDRTHAASNTAPAHPADRDRPAAPDDYCPICASMALVATAIPSLPPLLVVPDAIRHVWLAQAPVHRPPTQIALSFQARGPPLG
jgi:hypothetical protein